jgi:AAA ATPase domain
MSVNGAQPGYSGTPVVLADDRGDAIVGMLAIAGRAATTRDAYAIRLAQIAPAWPGTLARRIPPRCPYRGVQAFTAVDADAGLFVGREDEVDRLRRMTHRGPLTLVVGASGVGKSSLVSAGLLPALRQDGWAVASMRPGTSPFDSLARALLDLERAPDGYSLKHLNETAERLRREGLWRIANQLSLLLKSASPWS